MKIGRVLTAMVTPFDRQLAVDYARAAELARRLVDAGSDGLVVTGTTGEVATLTADERAKLWETVVDAVGDRVTVWAGTGTNDTAASIAYTRRAEAAGVHGVMLVVPYYNRPSQEGLLEHFKRVAGATKLPVLLYNVPTRTGTHMLAETTLRLAEEQRNIVGIKEAAGDLDHLTELCRRRPKEFAILAGDDKWTLPMLALGADGVVSVASHLVAGELVRMIDAFQRGNVRLATEIHLRLAPLFAGLFLTSNPVPVKWALKYIGFDVGGVRPPLAPPTAKQEEQLREVLRQVGLI